MTDTPVADAPVAEQAAPNLDALISSAMDKAEAPAAESGQGDPPTETQAQAEQRARDERGRFATKNSAPEASATGATEGAATAVSAEAKGPAPAVQQPEPHARWDDTRKATFAALPIEAKQFALDVHREQEAQFTRKAQELSDYRRSADPLLTAVQPFQQYLESVSTQIGVPPPALIGELLKTEYTLRNGNAQQKVQALGQIIQSYGIDLAAFVGGGSHASGQQPGAIPHDPAIINLRQQNAELSQRLEAINTHIVRQQQEAKAAQDREVHSTIESFATAKTEDGKPRYPHFARVRGVMSEFLAKGEASTMEQAYERAIAPINEAVAAELASRQKAADAERQAGIEKARKAAPVRSAGTMPNGATKAASLDALISESMAKAGIN